MSNDFDIPSKPLTRPSSKPATAKKQTQEDQVEMVDKVKPDSTPVQPKYSKEELLQIFDEIIFAGEYVEEVMIRGRVPVKFSTRTAEQVGQIQDALDRAGLTLISSVEQKRSIMALEQALVSFNGKDLSGLKPEERSGFIAKLAGPVIAILMEEMGKFDLKVAAACREEANF